MLRKKTHVVRKKTHVVRKFFYVASIFGGVARRRNRPPWELSSPPWTLSSTAGDFSSTASCRRQRLQCVYRAPVFSKGAHTSLPDTNILHTRDKVSHSPPPSEELTQSRDNLSSHRVKNLLLAISMRQFLCPCIQAVPHLCMQAFHGGMQVRKGGGWLVIMSARVVSFARDNRRIELMSIKDFFRNIIGAIA